MYYDQVDVLKNIVYTLKKEKEDEKNVLRILGGMDFEGFADSIRQQEIRSNERNKEIWENNKPRSYETWQLIAKAIVTNDRSNINLR